MNKVVESENEIDNGISPRFIILCDMDGTLVDTDYANHLSYKRAIEEVTRQKHEMVQFNAQQRFTRERLKEAFPCLTDDQCEDIVSLKAEYYSGYLPETRLNTTLADYIRTLSATNDTVLVTCCRKNRAVETLQYHDLLPCFSRLICREALSGSGLTNKYVRAFKLLSANPTDAVVYENDMLDIQQAILAGVPRENIISVSFTG